MENSKIPTGIHATIHNVAVILLSLRTLKNYGVQVGISLIDDHRDKPYISLIIDSRTRNYVIFWDDGTASLNFGKRKFLSKILCEIYCSIGLSLNAISKDHERENLIDALTTMVNSIMEGDRKEIICKARVDETNKISEQFTIEGSIDLSIDSEIFHIDFDTEKIIFPKSFPSERFLESEMMMVSLCIRDMVRYA